MLIFRYNSLDNFNSNDLSRCAVPYLTFSLISLGFQLARIGDPADPKQPFSKPKRKSKKEKNNL